MQVYHIDLHMAFDRVKGDDIWKSLKKRKIDEETVQVIKSMDKDNINVVTINNKESKKFKTEVGVQKGCVLSPILFPCVLDGAIKKAKLKMKQLKLEYWKMKPTNIVELIFADDIVVLADTEENLRHKDLI